MARQPFTALLTADITTLFEDNSAIANGAGNATANGTINTRAGNIILSGDTVTFRNNSVTASSTNGTATASGGAARANGSLTLNGRDVVFDNNRVSATGNSSSTPRGGAVYAGGSVTIAAANNLSFVNNVARSQGSAVYAQGNVELSGKTVSVLWDENVPSSVYAIYTPKAVQITADAVLQVTNENRLAYGGQGVTISAPLTVIGNTTQIHGNVDISLERVQLTANGEQYAVTGDNVVLKVDRDIVFTTADESSGAAIFSSGDVSLTTSYDVAFRSNNVDFETVGGGAAITAQGNVSVIGRNVSFDGNVLNESTTETGRISVRGGAVYASGD